MSDDDPPEAARWRRRCEREREARGQAETIGERTTRELYDAKQELEAFSYSVSHDLRAPLRAIDGFSRILIEECSDRLDAEGRRCLDVIVRNVGQMGRLIDDLLAFSRAGRSALEVSAVDMAGTARAVFAELQGSEPPRPVELRLGELPPAAGDPAMLRQVLANLLSNALKYSRGRVPAIVEVGASVGGGETVYFVRDNGVGFEMQYAHKLFGVFQRLHAQEDFEGTGVGLAIVERIVRRHGGRVWAEGEVDGGARFSFALPRPGGTDGDPGRG